MILKKECSLKQGMSVKEVDTKTGVVQGYFAAFNNVDSDGDIIVPGAFAKTIAERGPDGTKEIKHLRQHSRDDAFGRITILKEDEKGLFFESKAFSTTRAQDTLVLYHEGFFNQHSIGFVTMKGDWNEFSNAYEIKEVKLYEGSAVTWGANSQTPVTGLKGLLTQEEVDEYAQMLIGLKGRIEKYLRNGQKGTDNLFLGLEKQLKEIIAELGKLTTEPSVDTQPEEEKAAIEYLQKLTQKFS